MKMGLWRAAMRGYQSAEQSVAWMEQQMAALMAAQSVRWKVGQKVRQRAVLLVAKSVTKRVVHSAEMWETQRAD